MDKSAHTFLFHIQSARVRSLIGKDLKREHVLSGEQRIVKPPNSGDRWRVAWEHSGVRQ
jgi:hypothetical protein